MLNDENFLKEIQKELEKIGKKDMLTDETIHLLSPIFNSSDRIDSRTRGEI